MRRMTRFVHGTAGSVSIFLLIIIFSFVSLGGVLIDGIRVRTAKQRLELATEAAADSVLAEYSSKLANEYGIFVYKGEEGNSKVRAQDVVETYTSGVSDTFNIVTLADVEVSLETGNILNPAIDTKNLEDQLLESSKYIGVYTLGKGMLEALGFFEENGEAMESISEMVDKQDEINKLVEERNGLLKEVETKTSEIKNKLKNQVQVKAADLEAGTLALRCAESCLEEILVGTNENGVLSKSLKNLKENKEAYENNSDEEDYDEGIVALYDALISYLENTLIKNVKSTDRVATESLKALLNKFKTESDTTDEVIQTLGEVYDKIEEAREKNEKIEQIVGELKTTEETQEILDGLKNIIMQDQDFVDMKQKISDIKEEYAGYQVNVKIIESNLRSVINGFANVVRPSLTYNYVNSVGSTDNADSLKNKLYINIAKATGYLTGEGLKQYFPQITDLFDTAVQEELSHDFTNEGNVGAGDKMVEKIKSVNKWAEEGKYEENPDDTVKAQEEQYQTEADQSFTEIIDKIGKLQDVAADEAVYAELLSIVNTMQDISEAVTDIDTEKSQEEIYEQSNDLLQTILTGIKSLGNKVLINEYLLNEIGSKQPKDLFEDLTGNMLYDNKKLEFVMYGQYTSGANYALSMGEIMLIRLVMNTIGATQESSLDVFKPYPLIYLGVVLAYAIIHTAADIETLGGSDDKARSQRAVELIPNVLENITWTYKDHMRLMLLYHPRGGQYERLVAVMEKDTSIDGIASKPTQVKVESSASVELWFLPTITQALAGEGGVTTSANELKLTSIKYASY